MTDYDGQGKSREQEAEDSIRAMGIIVALLIVAIFALIVVLLWVN
jgi:hypothetical protein